MTNIFEATVTADGSAGGALAARQRKGSKPASGRSATDLLRDVAPTFSALRERILT